MDKRRRARRRRVSGGQGLGHPARHLLRLLRAAATADRARRAARRGRHVCCSLRRRTSPTCCSPRAASRQKEIAVRTAMGASRARLMQQMLVESLVLSSIGGAVGIACGRVGDRCDWRDAAAQPAAGGRCPRRLDRAALRRRRDRPRPGLLFGLAPAWHASRTDLNDVAEAGEPRIVERRTSAACATALPPRSSRWRRCC